MVKNLFAWASIGSNGKVVDDLAGDQTGKEVKIGEYYNFGQKWVIRFRSKKRGQKASLATKMLVRNNNIGYNQNNRKSLYNQCELIDWDIDRIYQIKPCDCDCSLLAVCAINFAYGKSLLPYALTTYSLPTIVDKHKTKFKRADKSIKTLKFHKGDMVGKSGHVIINV